MKVRERPLVSGVHWWPKFSQRFLSLSRIPPGLGLREYHEGLLGWVVVEYGMVEPCRELAWLDTLRGEKSVIRLVVVLFKMRLTLYVKWLFFFLKKRQRQTDQFLSGEFTGWNDLPELLAFLTASWARWVTRACCGTSVFWVNLGRPRFGWFFSSLVCIIEPRHGLDVLRIRDESLLLRSPVFVILILIDLRFRTCWCEVV